MFSTYASAREVLTDQFQPSGTDYIIHVLGDSSREEYLNCFNEGNFDYVVTMRREFTLWEYWVVRANWFFYREMYNNYQPVYSNSYETYWEKNYSNKENSIYNSYNVQIIDIDDTTKKLIIQTDVNINGFADVYLDYSVEKNSVFVFNPMLHVANTQPWAVHFDSNFLRAEGAEYIPITVKNGYGEVTITSNPQKHTTLNVNAVSCDRIINVQP